MRIVHLIASVAVSASVVATLVSPAAAAETVTQHITTDVATSGVTITCGQTSLTPIGGTLVGVFHENADGHGHYHYSGTDTANAVQLTDSAGHTYRLEGTSTFSGTSTDPGGEDNLVFTTTVAFTVLNDSGRRLGMVHFVEHLSPGAKVQLDSGQCTGTGGAD